LVAPAGFTVDSRRLPGQRDNATVERDFQRARVSQIDLLANLSEHNVPFWGRTTTGNHPQTFGPHDQCGVITCSYRASRCEKLTAGFPDSTVRAPTPGSARDQRELARELGHESGIWVFVKITVCAHLFSISVVADGNLIGQHQRFILIMGHIDEGGAEFRVDAL